MASRRAALLMVALAAALWTSRTPRAPPLATATIDAESPGRSPEAVVAEATEPLERLVQVVARGAVQSETVDGRAQVRFAVTAGAAGLRNREELMEAIDGLRTPDLRLRVRVDQPDERRLRWDLYSADRTPSELEDVARSQVLPLLKGGGIGEGLIGDFAAPRPDLEVRVNAAEARERGWSVAQVAEAIRTASVMPGGEVVLGLNRASVDGSSFDAATLKRLTLELPGGAVRLGDVGDVVQSPRASPHIWRGGGPPQVSDEHQLRVASAKLPEALEAFDSVARGLPQGVHLAVWAPGPRPSGPLPSGHAWGWLGLLPLLLIAGWSDRWVAIASLGLAAVVYAWLTGDGESYASLPWALMAGPAAVWGAQGSSRPGLTGLRRVALFAVPSLAALGANHLLSGGIQVSRWGLALLLGAVAAVLVRSALAWGASGAPSAAEASRLSRADQRVLRAVRRQPLLAVIPMGIALALGVSSLRRRVPDPEVGQLRFTLDIPPAVTAPEADNLAAEVASKLSAERGVELVEVGDRGDVPLAPGERRVDVLLERPVSGAPALALLRTLEVGVRALVPPGVGVSATLGGVGIDALPLEVLRARYPEQTPHRSAVSTDGALATDPVVRGGASEILLEPGPPSPSAIRLKTGQLVRSVSVGGQRIRVALGDGDMGPDGIFEGPLPHTRGSELVLEPHRVDRRILRFGGERVVESTRQLLSRSEAALGARVIDSPLAWALIAACIASLVLLPQPPRVAAALSAVVAGQALVGLLPVGAADALPIAVMATSLPAALMVAGGEGRRATFIAACVGVAAWIPSWSAGVPGAAYGAAFTAVASAFSIWGVAGVLSTDSGAAPSTLPGGAAQGSAVGRV